jgi:hypothetical protein
MEAYEAEKNNQSGVSEAPNHRVFSLRRPIRKLQLDTRPREYHLHQASGIEWPHVHQSRYFTEIPEDDIVHRKSLATIFHPAFGV